MTQTPAEIDIFTHNLSTRHVTELIIAAVGEGRDSICLIATKDQMATLTSQIRVELSRLYQMAGTHKADRFGLRISESINYTVRRDGDELKCLAVIVRPYHSPKKSIRKLLINMKSIDASMVVS